MTAPILFGHAADAGNTNPQSRNVQGILAHWTASGISAAVFSFSAVAPQIKSNPHLRILRIKPDRLWPLRLVWRYQERFSAIVNVGLHSWGDWMGLQLRQISGRSIPVVCTLEGLLGLNDDSDYRAAKYSAAAGHSVYCQPVPTNVLRQRDQILMSASHIIALGPFLRRMGEPVTVRNSASCRWASTIQFFTRATVRPMIGRW